ncbi:MAG: HNH endonuclease [Acidimicrobiaceae bacterium]|nr:HNH endonuclease [Acidimicrobiaceae bacterium]
MWRAESCRTATEAQRQILIARYGGCFHCAAHPALCQIHHIRPVSQGGSTKISNMVPVCWDCHQRIHHHKWQIRTTNGVHTLHPPGQVYHGPAHAPEDPVLHLPGIADDPDLALPGITSDPILGRPQLRLRVGRLGPRGWSRGTGRRSRGRRKRSLRGGRPIAASRRARPRPGPRRAGSGSARQPPGPGDHRPPRSRPGRWRPCRWPPVPGRRRWDAGVPPGRRGRWSRAPGRGSGSHR